MKTFRCTRCGHTVYFANVRCESCGSPLGMIPEERRMTAFERIDANPMKEVGAAPKCYRACRNYYEQDVCNWMVQEDDPHAYCLSCRLTEMIPDLSRDGNKQRWYKMELAKRRLIFSLQSLRLPLLSKAEDHEHGLAFRFLEDTPEQRVLTGHAAGVITLNLAEADDLKREEIRTAMREPYRTLLGHFRHEAGHYYWDRLIAQNPERLDRFRELFGDERADYNDAVKRHYEQGPPADWEKSFITAYATMHPWEDWAESWAHYLHMADALYTAEHWGFNLQPAASEHAPVDLVDIRFRAKDFHTLFFLQWLPLTRFLNSLNRSLGHQDAYPFTICAPAVEKLRFIDEIIRNR